MRVLFTFTGFHDPYAVGLIGDDQQPGPVLSLVSARQFDKVILFSTPTTEIHTQDTEAALKERHPKLGVRIIDLPLPDPTAYTAILRLLRKHVGGIVTKRPDDEYSVAVASGTPHMHACWVLLVSGGEIPAKLLHIRPPKYVTKDLPLVSEVDLSAPEFPEVSASLCMEPQAEYQKHIGLDQALQELQIVGEHPKFIQAVKMASVVAEHDTPVLVRGDTGTGKELIARLIHRLSARDQDTFIPVNCGSLPGNLIESILFGHKKGAFTGASSDQIGKFEQADGGTLFLDEIGELPAELQPRLLRVLEDGIIEPLGSKQSKKVDVRIVAATNRDLEQAIEKKEFREDLYYRISFTVISLPSLKERRSDIPTIALHLLAKLNASLKKPKRLSPEALSRLEQHNWRGNVRDLENVLGRSLMMATQEVLTADDLLIEEPRRKKDPLAVLPEPYEGFILDDYLKSARKQLILHALERSNGSQTGAAKLLGITPQAVHKFVRNQQK
ncbi:RNA repair transcriptional activator RtcR family protein [Verrucomicrobiota bacterium]